MNEDIISTQIQVEAKRPTFHIRKGIQTERLLGEGGMGKVFLGQQSFPKREIAIKKLHHVSDVLQFALLHEAMVIGKLEHPNIVPIHEIKYKGPDQSLEVVMKYVHGETLLEYILSKKFVLKRSIQVLIQVCNALEFAHSKNIYHRDVKPENIMLGDFGAIYLLDWGLAIDRGEPERIEQEGLVGTLGYMAPEMLKGDAQLVDTRTDVYLLGSTLHEVLTKEPRHNASEKDDIHQLIEESKVARYPSGTPRFLADLCNKSCVADKEKRIQRVADFRRALEHFLELEQAYILCEQGEKDTTLLQYFMKEEKESHIHQYFHSTRFAFEQSLRIQPDLMRSKEGLERLIDIWIDWSIKTGNESNFHLLNDSRLELSQESQKKIRIYQGEQREEQRERERWLRLGKNHDVRENIGIRLIIVFSLLGVVLFTASHLTENYSFEELMISNHQLMTEGAIMMVPILVFTIVVHLFFPKQYEIIRMAVGFLGTCFVMLLHRMIGFYYDVDPMAIINTDTFIAAFGFWSTYPAFRQGKNVGSFCFLMGICTMFFPDWFWYTNMLMIVAICLAISFEVIVVLRNRKMILLKNSAFASKK